METIPRPVLERVGMKVPANVKAMLNVRGLDVYDVLQLLTNTLNKVVRANDGNIDKEEDFLGRLNAVLNEWAERQEEGFETYKNMILNYMSTGELDLNGFIGSSAAFTDEFWRYFTSSLLESGKLVAPGDDGNVSPEKWMLRLTTKNGGNKWIDVDALYRAAYDAGTVWLEMSEEDGAELVDNERSSRGAIPFATAANGGLMHKEDKEKLDGMYVDDSNRLHVGDKVFQLTPWTKPDAEYNYTSIEFLEFSYGDIGADGGSAYPMVSVNQQVLIGTGVQKRVFITAEYRYDEEKGKMVLSYTNGDYMKEGGELALEFEATRTLPSNVLVGKDGVVKKMTAAEGTEDTEIAVVTVTARMNGAEEIVSTCSVKQLGASLGRYTGNIGNAAITQETYFDVAKSSGVSVAKSSVESDAAWFKITRTEVSDRYIRVFYTVEANNGAEQRTANVKAMTSLSDEAVTIATISQSSEQQRITGSATDKIGAGQADFREIEITKTAGVSLTGDDVTTDAAWIDINSVDISETRVKITYTALANQKTEKRTGYIYVKTSLGERSCVVTVEQQAKAQIDVSRSSLSFGGTEGGGATSETVTVTGRNLVGEITVEKSGAKAFAVSPSSISADSAAKGAVLTVTFTPGNAGSVTGSVKLKTANADDVTIALEGTVDGAVEAVTAYYGQTSTAPAGDGDIESAQRIDLTGENTVELTGAKHLWVAVPKDRAIAVSCTDNEQRAIVLTESTVGDWKVYDWKMAFVNTNTAHFTIKI